VVCGDGFLDAVVERGEQLRDGLEGLGLDVRGRGLMLAFTVAQAPELARRLLSEQRLVVNATGPETVRLLPPLTVSEAEVAEAVSRIERVISGQGAAGVREGA